MGSHQSSLHYTLLLTWVTCLTPFSQLAILEGWGGDKPISVQSLSRVWLFAAPWTAAHQASLTITNSWSLLKLMSMESVMPSNHLILCHPLHLLPSIFPSVRVSSNESVFHIRWPKYWSFSFSISPSNEYSDWFPLSVLYTQLKSTFQMQLFFLLLWNLLLLSRFSRVWLCVTP